MATVLETTWRTEDQVLVRAVVDALQRYDPIRASDSPIQVGSAASVVTLTGVVRSRTMRTMAERLARRVPGVADVDNQLLTDTDIEMATALELGTHERLRRAGGILVRSIFGTVYLGGEVTAGSLEEAEELKALAESIAQQVPGVTRTVSGIVARQRGQVAAAAAAEEVATRRSAAAEARLAELRERRTNWSERAAAAS